MYYVEINRNFVHQVGDQPRLYYDARSTNHQDKEYGADAVNWFCFPRFRIQCWAVVSCGDFGNKSWGSAEVE